MMPNTAQEAKVADNQNKKGHAKRWIILFLVLCVVLLLALYSYVQSAAQRAQPELELPEGFGLAAHHQVLEWLA